MLSLWCCWKKYKKEWLNKWVSRCCKSVKRPIFFDSDGKTVPVLSSGALNWGVYLETCLFDYSDPF